MGCSTPVTVNKWSSCHIVMTAGSPSQFTSSLHSFPCWSTFSFRMNVWMKKKRVFLFVGWNVRCLQHELDYMICLRAAGKHFRRWWFMCLITAVGILDVAAVIKTSCLFPCTKKKKALGSMMDVLAKFCSRAQKEKMFDFIADEFTCVSGGFLMHGCLDVAVIYRNFVRQICSTSWHGLC